MTDGMTKEMYESMEKNSQEYRRDKYRAFKIDEAEKASSGHFAEVEKRGFKAGIPEKEWCDNRKSRMSKKQANEIKMIKKKHDDLARGLMTDEERDESRRKGIETRRKNKELGIVPPPRRSLMSKEEVREARKQGRETARKNRELGIRPRKVMTTKEYYRGRSSNG